MLKSKLTASLSIAALALSIAGTARADVIDFTTGSWTANNPQDVSGVWVTLLAYDSNNSLTTFTETGFDGDISQCGPLGLACDADGIGISDDEVTYGSGTKEQVERLVVTFSSPVDIASMIFLDLFGADSSTDTPAERVQFQVNGNGAGGGWDGTAADRTGFFVGTIGNVFTVSDANAFTGVTSIDLFADDFRLASPSNSDFALAGIELVSVPEPGTLALLGLGLIGIGAARRRNRVG